MRLDVSVDYLVLMSDFQRSSDLLADIDHLFVIHRSFILDDVVECTSLNELHYDVVDVALTAYIVNSYNIRMCKARSRLRLPLEVLDECCVLGKFRSQYLDSDESVKKPVFALVYDSHSSVTDLLKKLVPA